MTSEIVFNMEVNEENIKSVLTNGDYLKPKKKSIIERELETSLTPKITSPISHAEATSTSRYGRARKLKSELLDAYKKPELKHCVSNNDKSPNQTPTSFKIHSTHLSNNTDSFENGVDSQIEYISNENLSLSRFGSEKKNCKGGKPKTYMKKDLIQTKDKDDTVILIKNMFSPNSAGSRSNTHSGKANNKYRNDISSVVKILDFEGKKKKKETPEKKVSQSELFELEAQCEFQVGDLAWARMGTYPFWPSIVTREPSSMLFVKKKLYGKQEKDIVHVTFLGDNGRRGWILSTMLRKYLGLQEFETARNQFTPSEKKKDPRLYAAFFVSEKRLPLWKLSVTEAETLFKEPKRLRIDILSNMILGNKEIKEVPTKSKKVHRTNSDVSLSESLYDSLFSEDDLRFSESDSAKNKARKKSFDVSDVVTACLDNMAAKTGITTIQKQSHMDRWLQKAKSQTPEKSHSKPKTKVNTHPRGPPSNHVKYNSYNLDREYQNKNLVKLGSYENEHNYTQCIYNNGQKENGINFVNIGNNLNNSASGEKDKSNFNCDTLGISTELEDENCTEIEVITNEDMSHSYDIHEYIELDKTNDESITVKDKEESYLEENMKSEHFHLENQEESYNINKDSVDSNYNEAKNINSLNNSIDSDATTSSLESFTSSCKYIANNSCFVNQNLEIDSTFENNKTNIEQCHENKNTYKMDSIKNTPPSTMTFLEIEQDEELENDSSIQSTCKSFKQIPKDNDLCVDHMICENNLNIDSPDINGEVNKNQASTLTELNQNNCHETKHQKNIDSYTSCKLTENKISSHNHDDQEMGYDDKEVNRSKSNMSPSNETKVVVSKQALCDTKLNKNCTVTVTPNILTVMEKELSHLDKITTERTSKENPMLQPISVKSGSVVDDPHKHSFKGTLSKVVIQNDENSELREIEKDKNDIKTSPDSNTKEILRLSDYKLDKAPPEENKLEGYNSNNDSKQGECGGIIGVNETLTEMSSVLVNDKCDNGTVKDRNIQLNMNTLTKASCDNELKRCEDTKVINETNHLILDNSSIETKIASEDNCKNISVNLNEDKDVKGVLNLHNYKSSTPLNDNMDKCSVNFIENNYLNNTGCKSEQELCDNFNVTKKIDLCDKNNDKNIVICKPHVAIKFNVTNEKNSSVHCPDLHGYRKEEIVEEHTTSKCDILKQNGPPRGTVFSSTDNIKDNSNMHNAAFLQFLEIKRDFIMDDNPEFTYEEVKKYIFKMWQYEESLKTVKEKSSGIQKSNIVQDIKNNKKPENRISNKESSNEESFEEYDKPPLQKKISKRALQLKKDKFKQTLLNFTKISKDGEELKNLIKKDLNSFSTSDSDTDAKMHEIGKHEYSKKNCSNAIGKLYIQSDIIKKEKTVLQDSKSEELDDQNLNFQRTMNAINNTEHADPLPNSNLGLNGKTDTSLISEKPVKSKDIQGATNAFQEPGDATENTSVVQVSKCDDDLVCDTKEINKTALPRDNFDDNDNASVKSEDSDTPLAKRKSHKEKKSNNRGLQDPEFLKYLRNREDQLADEHPEITSDEISSYLYNTWRLQEKLRADAKKSDFEQNNYIKGLAQDPVKKVKRKVKSQKDVVSKSDEVLPKEKSKRRTERQFYRDDYSDFEDEIELFQIFKTTPSGTIIVDPESSHASTPHNEIHPPADTKEPATTASTEIVPINTTKQFDQVEEYFRQLTQIKPNLFKGLAREKVCEICEKVGNLVKCKGCHGMFHTECSAKVVELKESPVPVRGRKKKRKYKGRKKGLDDSFDDCSDERSQTDLLGDGDIKPLTIADADYFEEKFSAKMKEMLENPETKYDTNSSDDELSWSDTEIGKCVVVDRIPKKKEPSALDFKCENCKKYDTPVCFVCKGAVSPKQRVEHRQRCQIAHCYKYYHVECLEHWPQTQLSSGEAGAGRALTCPRHVCHTCVCDDPRGCRTRFSGDKLARCVRCPATYHAYSRCLPAGARLLSGSHVLCPRHYRPRPGKVPCHVNTGWCFICALGGSLICCEYCPTSFHAECLNIDPPEGGYMCEDCETGSLPRYGEMVWVKLGHYRWWPGLILHPAEVPENIQAVRHEPGEFVVRFFGQYDHYWVNRGRVFPFQEGDTGRISSRNSKIDAAFAMAVEHAQRAYQILKESPVRHEGDEEIASSLRPPHYVKLKVNKPCAPLRRAEPDAAPAACDCDPRQPDPCGPYSQCLNRMLLTECGPSCAAGERCSNRAFERRLYPRLEPYRTPQRGWGLRTLQHIPAGQFVIEYVGELIDEAEFRRRMAWKHRARDENYYFLTLDKERMIDAGPKGNLARFMNHSCEPNCETQKWTVLGDVRVGLFALHDIPPMSELTFNYNLECAGIEMKRCMCGAQRCSGYMGAKPKEEPKKNKGTAKRTYKKRKPVEQSPSTSAKPKPRRPRARDLSDIEKDLLIIQSATADDHTHDTDQTPNSDQTPNFDQTPNAAQTPKSGETSHSAKTPKSAQTTEAKRHKRKRIKDDFISPTTKKAKTDKHTKNKSSTDEHSVVASGKSDASE